MKNLPADQRPREKLLARGPAALADAELLALLLRSGIAGSGVLALAQQVLQRCGGFAGLLQASAQAELKGIKGLGPAKQAELLAVAEIARRALAQPLRERPVLENSQAVRDFLALHLDGHPQERFAVMFLDARLQLLHFEVLFSGTLAHTEVHPREVVRQALRHNAAAVVLAHNHPSGLAEPSVADERLTRTLVAALKLVDVRVLDHIVVGRGHTLSLAEKGLM
jgi:DNA repair protein RadC